MPEAVLSGVLAQLQQNAEEKVQKRRKRTKDVLNEKKPKSIKKLTKKERQINAMAEETVLPDHYHLVWTEQELRDMCTWLDQQSTIAVDTETMGVNPFIDEIVGISLYAPHRGYYIPLKHIMDVGDEEPAEVTDEEGNFIRAAIIGVDYVKCLDKTVVANALRPILENREKRFLGHNCK